MKKLLYILLSLSLFVVSTQAELVVIVNKDFPSNSIKKSDLKKIYANKMKTWSHGGTIVRSVLKKGKTHKSFCKVIKKSSSKLKRFWKKQVFTGKGSALKSFGSESDLVSFIASNKDALGYVDSSTDTSQVKVLSLD